MDNNALSTGSNSNDQLTTQNPQNVGSSNLFPDLNGSLQNGSANPNLNNSGSNAISLPGLQLSQEVDNGPSVPPTSSAHRWLLAGGIGLVIVIIAVAIGWRLRQQLADLSARL